MMTWRINIYLEFQKGGVERDMKKDSKWIYLGIDFLCVVLLLLFDQFTKKLAVSHLKDNKAFVLWKNVFELDYLENRGSAFGLFQNKKVFLLLVGVVFVIIILAVLYRVPKGKKYLPLHALLSLLIAGGLGNMVDRFLQGYVVDFFSFVLIHFPVFNVADIYIVVSTFLLAFLFFFYYKEEDLEFFTFKRS